MAANPTRSRRGAGSERGAPERSLGGARELVCARSTALCPVIERGDIRWFRFDHPDKRRPVLVLGRDDLLDTWSLIPVIPLSTQIRGLPWEVELTPDDDGVASACVLKPEWIRAVDRTKLGPRITTLREPRWADVGRATMHVLALESVEAQ